MSINELSKVCKDSSGLWNDLVALSARFDRQNDVNVMTPLKRMIARSNVAANMTGDFLIRQAEWFKAHPEVSMSVITNNINLRNATRVPNVVPSAVFAAHQPAMGLPA